jgi:hypothetical protein
LLARKHQAKVKVERVPWTEVVPRTVAMAKEAVTRTVAAPRKMVAALTLIPRLTLQLIPFLWLLARAAAEKELKTAADPRGMVAALLHDCPLFSCIENFILEYSPTIIYFHSEINY